MSLRARAFGVGILSLVVVFLCLPSLLRPSRSDAARWMPTQAIRLGLDLQGGTYWRMRIDTDEATAGWLREAVSTLEAVARDAQVDLGRAAIDPAERAIDICGADDRALQEVVAAQLDAFELTPPTGGCRRMVFSERGLSRRIARVLDQSIDVLQARLTENGKEAIVARQGSDRILIQLPGADFEERNRQRGKVEDPAVLEFKQVLDVAASERVLVERYPRGFPPDTVVSLETLEGRTVAAYLLPVAPVVTGDLLEDARVVFDDRTQEPVVAFTWNGEGTARFRSFTRANIGRSMAILKDGDVLSAPVIRDGIGREGQISAGFTPESAHTLAVQLRSGSLGVRLVVEEERTVGPSLGEDSIRAGLSSIALGGLLVVGFMIAYYRTAGVVADLALLLNLAMVLAVMGSFEATLTLPGIAGLVLTVGMAVDANVIVFERVREELRENASPRAAIQVGFQRSARTILDANLTTLLAGGVLYLVGSGPVQGFGLTLVIGIGSSVFCALVVTRVLIDLVLARAHTLRI